ncbi:MAG: O-methyltransferase [Haloarculaceae archaeon]
MIDDTDSETVAALAHEIGPEPDEILREMGDYAAREGFPTVGPEVGGWLAVLARLVDARRVFEFGSGFGYSAYWFARELPVDGEVVLTEIDAGELDDAREYFRQGGLSGRARFEHGDAIEIVADYEGPFDVVLIDNEKERYLEALEAVEDTLRPGSVVLADNAVTSSHVDPEGVLGSLRGQALPEVTAQSAGIARYLDGVRDRDDFATALLPLGEGVAVSVRQ